MYMLPFLLHKVCKQINTFLKMLQKLITHACFYLQLCHDVYFMTTIYQPPANLLNTTMCTSFISFIVQCDLLVFFKFFTPPAIFLQRNQPLALNKSENNCVQITFKLSDSFAFYYILAFCQIRISLLLLCVLVCNRSSRVVHSNSLTYIFTYQLFIWLSFINNQ